MQVDVGNFPCDFSQPKTNVFDKVREYFAWYAGPGEGDPQRIKETSSMDSRINNQQNGLRVEIDSSRGRQTPRTDFGSVMATGLSRTAGAVMDAGQLAAPFIPGGAVLSAAITGVGTLKASAAGQSAASPNGVGLGGTSGGVGTVNASGSSSGGGGVDALAAGGDSQAILMQETRRMQELNQSFNMQYLQLQQKMQADNREFTTLSNIMKTKHDTAKNAINNVR